MNHSNREQPYTSATTFLFCVESGYFEKQTLLAIECLRRFGGQMSDSPVLVITPRYGPALETKTLKRLQQLDAKYVYRNEQNRCSWYVYMNKALAAAIADDLVDTEQIAWLDSDVLVVSDPAALLLKENEDFACCSIDKNVGTTGPGDPNNKYWLGLSEYLGVPLECLPLVQTEFDRQLVRFRLHSGVYAFRAGMGLGRAFAKDLESMLTCGLAYSKEIPFPGDDVALAFSVARLKLRWRRLEMSCNFEMTPNSDIYSSVAAQRAKILHFHNALSGAEQCDWFIRELESFRPDVAEWLLSRVPLERGPAGIYNAIVRRILYETRKFRANVRAKGCTFAISSS